MPSQRRLRRFAAYVLLVWLFGLGSGIVNACVVADQLRQVEHATVPAHHDHGAMALHSAAAEDAQPGAHDESGNDLARPPCERLCDAPPAAPQADKQSANPLGAGWLAAAPLPSFDFRPLARPSAATPDAGLRWVATIPIPIAFLRLTL
jgi:hypothetical protein